MIWAALLALALPAGAAPGALERAAEAELSRASRQLRAKDYPSPYFVSLTISDIESFEKRCQLGADSFEGRFRQRLATPDLRVGSRELDNHPVSTPANFVGRMLPTGDDEPALRHGLWRMFDSSYKTAAADFLRKQALRVSRGKAEYDTDDLALEPPRFKPSAQPPSQWKTAELESLCRAGSGVLQNEPSLLHGESTVRLRRLWSRLWDSEGSRVDFGRELAEIELEAVDLSTDGTRLYASRKFVAPSPASLPSQALLRAEAAAMLQELAALKVAQTTSPFSAPALIDPSVSAAVVLAMGTRLSGEEQRNPGGAQTFRGKLGTPVLPEEFSLVDDPTVASLDGKPLAGHYEFDDQGVPARPASLIENGLLRGFLLSRYPVVGFERSNGHGRGYPGYWPEGAPGVLFLRSKKQASQQELLARLRAECRKRGKPYGIWLRQLRHFSQQQGTGGHAAIRFMPTMVYLVDAETGAMTLMRDLDLVGTPLAMMGNLLAAGDDARAHNLVYGVPVSVVVGSLLLSDAELQRAETKPEKSPILPAPGAKPTPAAGRSERVPTIPRQPHVQVLRYRIRGFGRPVPGFAMDGLESLRQHMEGEDAILEAKLSGESLPALGSAARRLDESVRRLAGDKPVERSAVTPVMTRSAFDARLP